MHTLCIGLQAAMDGVGIKMVPATNITHPQRFKGIKLRERQQFNTPLIEIFRLRVLILVMVGHGMANIGVVISAVQLIVITALTSTICSLSTHTNVPA